MPTSTPPPPLPPPSALFGSSLFEYHCQRPLYILPPPPGYHHHPAPASSSSTCSSPVPLPPQQVYHQQQPMMTTPPPQQQLQPPHPTSTTTPYYNMTTSLPTGVKRELNDVDQTKKKRRTQDDGQLEINAARTLASFATARHSNNNNRLEDGSCCSNTNGQGKLLCDQCNISFQHSSCLQRHRWEHESWKVGMSKRQQVQIVEVKFFFSFFFGLFWIFKNGWLHFFCFLGKEMGKEKREREREYNIKSCNMTKMR